MPRQKMLALDGLGEQQRIWELLPSGPRSEVVAQYARLVLGLAQEEAMNEEGGDEQETE